MTDLLQFLPLFQEDETTVRARMDADANAGLATSDPRWMDTRQGTFYYDITQVVLLELLRLWDSLAVEVPAAAFVVFAWGEYLDNHANLFNLTRKVAVPASGTVTVGGVNGTLVPAGTVFTTEAASEDAPEIEFVTTASVTIPAGLSISAPIEASDAGVEGNVAANSITDVGSPIPGLTVNNATATSGGTDIESDEELRARILLEFQGKGAGNVNDYKRWALSIAGVGRVFVNPVWAGPGTVQVVVMTATGDPVGGSIVTAVQNFIDPTPGTADGEAPPGVNVTVQTPTAVNINIAASVTFKPGYSLTGTGGTTFQNTTIVAALSNYIDNLDVGEDVIYNHVLAQFFRAEGVLNVTGLTVNGSASDVAISVSGPTQIASLGTTTLT